jgi:hypothetical protein
VHHLLEEIGVPLSFEPKRCTSYGLTVELLKEVLPISQELSTTAIRQRVRQTAQRLEDELGEEQVMFVGGCQRDWDQLPDPAAPLIVGIDGGYVHAKGQQSRAEGWFEVIVGKSMSQDGESSKCFGFVNRYDTKPKRRLFETLKSQGMQMNQAVTFLSDGGDTVRDLQNRSRIRDLHQHQPNIYSQLRWLRFQEKRGKEHEVPVHSKAKEAVDLWLERSYLARPRLRPTSCSVF